MGLIPARAGNTPLASSPRRRFRAHPRSRGEHVIFAVLHAGLRGSSPLARGTLFVIKDDYKAGGLIPARAGNTQKSLHGGRSRRAHPRSRGEHQCGLSAVLIRRGSSPLARGTRFQCVHDAPHAGLIPARAGNTWTGCGRIFQRGAHPRSRGEHALNELEDEMPLGSSPLARGTLSYS